MVVKLIIDKKNRNYLFKFI